ncbi:branched-chain amino acid ABC transporter permease [Endozoicomonas sp. OPT23]|uniref:ABC transporter permease n=1 Tax=Endozoicomonas sp. OPT23 TaxID=2072845 RepID=UPI00129B9054|nr:ABC transporter permease [Endozoicomonas sp. OPT23]MRI31509.1 branched-chain amino acid ABC transporter permease [Endozoicomonas sp. OPT23]
MIATETMSWKEKGSSLFKSWESLLLILLLLICLANTWASPYFLDIYNLMDSTAIFSEKAVIALSMALIIISRDIDLSVASIIALTSTVIGYFATLGFDTFTLLWIGVFTGAICGGLNGFIVTKFAVPAIVVTIGTMSLYRGISWIVLGDRAYTDYPENFWVLGQGYLFDLIPYEFIAFLVLAVGFGLLLHKTTIGRNIYALGNNPRAALYSGINVNRYRFWLFVLNGTMAGLAGVFLTSRLGATRPNIAMGWELEIITIVVLGGVNILGGSGSIAGVVLAAFIIGMLTFGLGLLNVPGILMTIIIGLLLISAIAAPILIKKFKPAGGK